MAAVELTRMDFHVARFMESEAVEEMTCLEVGQFCLLLFKAWMLAKDVTLPVDSSKLARWARVDRVSPLVLRQFPVVETQWGKRRQNEVQLEVWRAAQARSAAGKTGAKFRWDKRPQCDRNATSDEVPMLEHTIPSIPSIPSITEQAGRPSPLEIYADKVSDL